MCVLCISSGRSRWSDSRAADAPLVGAGGSYAALTVEPLLHSSYGINHSLLSWELHTNAWERTWKKYKGTLCQRRTPPAEYSLTLSFSYCSHTLAEYGLPPFFGLLFCSCLYLEKLSLYEILIDYFSPNFANALLIYVKICKTPASSST